MTRAQQQRLTPFTNGEERGEKRHVVSVAELPGSMEVQPAEIAASNGVQSLDLEGLILDSLVAARLDHGQACACMADEDGKPLDQSQWKRMRASGNLPLGRMRQLPLAFWQCFIPVLARAAGLCVVRAEDVAQFVIRVNVERRVG